MELSAPQWRPPSVPDYLWWTLDFMQSWANGTSKYKICFSHDYTISVYLYTFLVLRTPTPFVSHSQCLCADTVQSIPPAPTRKFRSSPILLHSFNVLNYKTWWSCYDPCNIEVVLRGLPFKHPATLDFLVKKLCWQSWCGHPQAWAFLCVCSIRL